MFLAIKEYILDDTKRSVFFLALAGLSLVISFFHLGPWPVDAAWIAILLCGVPIIKGAVEGLITSFDIKADVLVSLALVAAVAIGETFAAGEIAFIMQIGALLEERTVAKARAGLEKLIHLTPRTARVLTGKEENVIPAEQVKVDDLLRVLPGETIPVDGVIIEGETAINQAVMTGESLPVDKQKGDFVSSGTVNQFGAFVMQATKVGEDSSLQRMIRLVQSADAGKAKIVGLADRWATWIVILALLAAGLTWFFTGEIIRAVTILVVFCPCALVLATPTAIMAAIGNATRHGFLVRQGDALERLAKVKRIGFDKTGTLTHGKPKVVAIESFVPNLSPADLYRAAAGAELRSEHPLGKAVIHCYQQEFPGQAIPEPQAFAMLPGRGVTATVEGKRMLAGNWELLAAQHINVPQACRQAVERYIAQGCTIIYLAWAGTCSGFIALADTLRDNVASMMATLATTGVQPVLLTGDNEKAARHIATQVGIGDVHANCLPEDKLRLIKGYQKKKEPVCMIGDGINDAPALKRAYVGIAMGGVGSDIAVEAADIALVNDQIRQLPHLLGLAKKMMTTIQLNLSFAMGLNLIAIFLAITGILNPVVGALVHNAGSVLVILNSALLLHWHQKHGGNEPQQGQGQTLWNNGLYSR